MKTDSQIDTSLAVDGPPRPWLAAIVLAGAIGVVYAPALSVPFIFDDHDTITQNSSIVSLWPLVGTHEHPGPLNPRPQIPTSGRPLVNLSFAINYLWNGISPVAFHAVNVLIHFLSALLLWAIVRRTLQLPYFAGRFDTSAGWLALAVALLWALHPLQTETVIYATQRTELMFAFFYLATLYCSLRYMLLLPLPPGEGRGEGALTRCRQRNLWLTLAVLASAAGMASKEVMVSAPLMVLLFERTFVAGSLPAALRRSWPLYIGLVSTLLLLVILNIHNPRSESAGFGLEVPVHVWWLTQMKVFVLYMKLAVWPWPLLLQYQLPYLQTIGAAWKYALPVLLLGLVTLLLLWRNLPAGYLGTWVFAILAPTSIVPVVTEVAAERRIYLPLAAIVVLVVIGAWQFARRASKWLSDRQLFGDWLPHGVIAVPALIAILFGVVDAKRLYAYRDEMNLWREVLLHEPKNHIAHANLGYLLSHAGRTPEAIVELQTALALKPNGVNPLNNLGVALAQVGRAAEGIEKLKETIRLNPNYTDAYSNLGMLLSNSGHHDEAIQEIQKAIALKPDDAVAYYNLALAYVHAGRYPEAIEHFELALRWQPQLSLARINLAAALSQTGKSQQAIEQLQLAVKLAPNDVNALNSLGLLLANSGHLDDAITQFQHAVRLRPDRPDIHNNLGRLLQQTGRPVEAIEHFQNALRFKPDYLLAYTNLAKSLAAVKRSTEAIAAAQKAIAIAHATSQQPAAEQMEKWLKDYQAGLPPSEAAKPTP